MFNIRVNQSQFALFVAKLKNLTSNQMKKTRYLLLFEELSNELITFTWNFISF